MAIEEQALSKIEHNSNSNYQQHLVNDRNKQHTSNSNMSSLEPIDFDECLRDSPKFRHALKDNLNSIESLETCMNKTLKQIANYIETGRDHIKSQQDLTSSIRSLNNTLKPHKETTDKIGDLLEVLDEITRLNEIVIDQSSRTIGKSLHKFINDDLMKLREARKSFDKISHEYDQALMKHSQPIKKQHEDTENLLIAISTAFTHTSLDLSIQLTSLQSKKGYEILGSLLSFIKAQSTFFHQGYDLFEDFKPRINNTDEYLSRVQDEFETMTRNLPSKHLMVSNNELKPLSFDNSAQEVHLEGYLFKRASNGFKVWNRRWFILKDHKLIYMKRGDIQPIVMEEDLRLLTVRHVDKVDFERRFCFEIVSPHKSHILQADSKSDCKTWIQAIQVGINAAFHDTETSDRLSHKPSQASEAAYSSISSTNSSSSNQINSSSTPTHKQQQQHNGSNSNNLTNSTGATSWSSSLSSWRALQQQATHKLNSITGSSDLGSPREMSGDRSKEGASKSSYKTSLFRSSKSKPSSQHSQQQYNNEEPDDNSDNELVLDEHGRSYALLPPDDDGNDDDEYAEGQNRSSDSETVARYPAPALPSNEHGGAAESQENQQETSTKEPPPEKPQRAYMIILAMPGNDRCADCEATQPRWASINLGITLCIECAGIHRSLGVHLSKVRSLTLDTEVWSPEIVRLMLSLGNISVNGAYLACYRDQIPRITAESSREERENWIKAKYLKRSFMRPPGTEMNSSLLSEENATCDPVTSSSITTDSTTTTTTTTDAMATNDVLVDDDDLPADKEQTSQQQPTQSNADT